MFLLRTGHVGGRGPPLNNHDPGGPQGAATLDRVGGPQGGATFDRVGGPQGAATFGAIIVSQTNENGKFV